MTKFIRIVNIYRQSFNFNNDLNEYLKFRKKLIKNFNKMQLKISNNEKNIYN
jgi:hypothetical protein